MFIERLLSLSRLESSLGREKVLLGLDNLLAKVIAFFGNDAETKNITLTSELEDNVQILGNQEELQELFSNLISNAIKYMRNDGERNIHTTLKKDGDHAVITLQDTGIGIRNENVQHLFQKFYRIKEEETKGKSGTGLGLVICKKIVEKHNGTITVSSTFGKGTLFTITIPLLLD